MLFWGDKSPVIATDAIIPRRPPKFRRRIYGVDNCYIISFILLCNLHDLVKIFLPALIEGVAYLQTIKLSALAAIPSELLA